MPLQSIQRNVDSREFIRKWKASFMLRVLLSRAYSVCQWRLAIHPVNAVIWLVERNHRHREFALKRCKKLVWLLTGFTGSHLALFLGRSNRLTNTKIYPSERMVHVVLKLKKSGLQTSQRSIQNEKVAIRWLVFFCLQSNLHYFAMEQKGPLWLLWCNLFGLKSFSFYSVD